MAAHWRYEREHNICAFLDTTIPQAQPYLQMLQFLHRSRIYFAISAKPAIGRNLIDQFWSTAVYNCETDPPSIRATVAGHEIVITEDTVRNVLQFGDNAGDRTEFPLFLIKGCFQRMGYIGQFSDSRMRKTNLSPKWRFLMHILIVCLSARKPCFNWIDPDLRSPMVALVLNKPYNFSKYVFNSMIHNAGPNPHKFHLFPRFIQLMLNAQVDNLPIDGYPLYLRSMPMSMFSRCKQYRKCGIWIDPPPNVDLFGHIVNPDYQEPAEDNWIDPPQQEQQEQPVPSHQAPPVVQLAPPQQAQPRVQSIPQQLREQPVPSQEHVAEQQANPENVYDSDDSTGPLDSRSLAALKRVVSPRTFAQLQRASQRVPQPRQAQRRREDVDPDFEVEDKPLVRRRRVNRSEIASTSLQSSQPLSTPPASEQPELSHMLSLLKNLQTQVQAMQTTIDSQQEKLVAQDLRITSLESELQELKKKSAVQGENSESSDADDNDDADVDLSLEKCVPCNRKDLSPMTEETANVLKAKVVPEWELLNDGGVMKLRRKWKVKSSVKGLDLFKVVCDLAEAEGHHPDLHLVGWNNVTVEIWTHACGGLTENDFILAAKIDKFPF